MGHNIMSALAKLIVGIYLLLLAVQAGACTAADVTTGANLESCIFESRTVVQTIGNRTDLSGTNLSHTEAVLGLELINIVAYDALPPNIGQELNLAHANINNLRLIVGGRRRNGETGRPTGGINYLNMEEVIAPEAWIDAYTNQSFGAFIDFLTLGGADIHGGTITGNIQNLVAAGANLNDVTLNIPLDTINNPDVLEDLFFHTTQNNRLHLPIGVDLRRMEAHGHGPIDPTRGWHFAVDAPSLILPTLPNELNFAGLNAPGIDFQYVALGALRGVNFYGANITNAVNFNHITTLERVNYGLNHVAIASSLQ